MSQVIEEVAQVLFRYRKEGKELEERASEVVDIVERLSKPMVVGLEWVRVRGNDAWWRKDEIMPILAELEAHNGENFCMVLKEFRDFGRVAVTGTGMLINTLKVIRYARVNLD